ncbi:FixH family protein [Bosea sp. SSUT16]|uniref:FixH family protein n=1 Tax=Bosea spartocytisi TaxID=2773451 RepID=A0A927EFJ0_9HYPH|nr:FixH family protein [Bosea spartocytisi]MBD3849530.1 FixH family protein [Bosea spartocytisi]MCT4475372.1 FixH family protein [Bosea spartocytisi]
MIITRTLRALVAALPLTAVALPALADIKDYEFQLTQSEFKQGDGVVITVKLIDKRSGKPVPDAVIFAKRIDMEPEGMAAMASPIEMLPSPEAGAYSFKTKLVMEGGWRLSLGAKVQGETGTLENKLILEALP